MNIKTRLKWFKKIAQTTTATPTETPKVLAPPPTFQASAMYPGLRTGFNTNSIRIIDNLVNLLNSGVYYSSNGQMNFQLFKNNNFNFDASAAISVDQKNLMNLSKKIFVLLLNSGNSFPKLLTGNQIHSIIDQLSSSPEFTNLSQVNQTGTLAIKIGGNLKTMISDNFNYLKLANPV